MARQTGMPLRGAPPKEIMLPRAPLVSVVAQVRFSALLTVRRSDHMIGFHERIRMTYPHLERQEIPAPNIAGPLPATTSTSEPLVYWRFTDEPSTDWKWRITLTQDFVSLETREYRGRQDFLSRLQELLQALQDTLGPTHVTRFGVRYIDQIKAPAVAKIDSLVRKEVIGVACSVGPEAKHCLTELYVPAEPGDLLARWGKLPANLTIDPNLMPPLEEETWLLDLDVSQNQSFPFDTTRIIEVARRATERVYSVFRWMVTPAFLKTYGGDA